MPFADAYVRLKCSIPAQWNDNSVGLRGCAQRVPPNFTCPAIFRAESPPPDPGPANFFCGACKAVAFEIAQEVQDTAVTHSEGVAQFGLRARFFQCAQHKASPIFCSAVTLRRAVACGSVYCAVSPDTRSAVRTMSSASSTQAAYCTSGRFSP